MPSVADVGNSGCRSFSLAPRAGSCLSWNPGPPSDPEERTACPQAKARQEAAAFVLNNQTNPTFIHSYNNSNPTIANLPAQYITDKQLL